jgi:hypothetical protein
MVGGLWRSISHNPPVLLSALLRRRGPAAILLASLALFAVELPLPANAATVPAFDHVFVIVMENTSYSSIIGNPAAPYINSLVATGGLGANYFAVTHPSLPNYLALVGGDTFGINSDCTTCWVSAPSIADSVENAGKSWKAYQESMPSACFVGDSYPYVQKHDPFIYFNNIRTNASRCRSHVVPYSQLSGDLSSASTTPNYAFITPNNCNDMHDCSIATGDTWLSQQVPQILTSPAFTTQRSLLALVWDEDDFAGTNQVPLILLGSGITASFQSSLGYDHYSLLRTIEVGLGLPALTANDTSAASMSDFFGVTTPPPPPPPPPPPGQLPAIWASLGGVLTESPHGSSWGSARVDAFVRGTDNGLYQNTWNGATWSGWSSLGGVLTSGPAAVSWSGNRIDAFVRGTDNQLYHRVWNGGRWHGWEALGGVLTSAPVAASWSAGRLDVFVRGTDNALYHKVWDGRWSGWEGLGGDLTSDPGAVSWSANRVDVVARGIDNAIWIKSWNGSGWSDWSSLGGNATSAPSIASCGTGRIDVFVRGTDNGVSQLSFNGSSWTAWRSVGGSWTSGPSAVCRPGTATIDLFARGTDNALWTQAVPGT